MQTRDGNLGSHGGLCEPFLARSQAKIGHRQVQFRAGTNWRRNDCAAQQMALLDFRNGSNYDLALECAPEAGQVEVSDLTG